MAKQKKTAGVAEIAALILEANKDATRKDVETGVKATLEAIRTLTGRGETVKVVGFGSFSRKDKPAGTARNPKNGQIVQTEAKSTLHFKSSPEVYA